MSRRSMNPALVQTVFDFAIREINALEQRIVQAEDDADAMLWQQAEQVIAQLDAGLSQRDLARQWINVRTGEPYSQMHVSYVRQVVEKFTFQVPRPRFREAYNEIANAKKLAVPQPWHGRVFMNPPYGHEIEPWIEKLSAEHETGNVSEAIALVPGRVDTQWFKRMRDYVCCFVEGRLTFIGNTASAPFPSVLVYFGEDIGKFYHHVIAIGDVWQRIEPPMFAAERRRLRR